MLTTTNYKFKKPELTDSPPDITATNENWDTLDANLKDAQDKATNWDTFRKNGGEIGADITTKNIYMSSGLISSGGMTLNFKGNDQKMLFFGATDTRNISGKQECGLVVIRRDDGSGFSLRPTTDGRDYTDLGANTHKFANGYFSGDLFINGFSKSTNGYTKLPNGLILQWGAVSVTGGVNGVEVILPIAFNGNYRLTVSPVDLSLGITPITAWVTGKSNTQFWVRTTSKCSAQWIAIGW